MEWLIISAGVSGLLFLIIMFYIKDKTGIQAIDLKSLQEKVGYRSKFYGDTKINNAAGLFKTIEEMFNEIEDLRVYLKVHYEIKPMIKNLVKEKELNKRSQP